MVSDEEGSPAAVKESAMALPSLTEAGALNVAVGATFATVKANVVVAVAPKLSVAVIVTV